MTDKKLKEERHHGDISLPVSCYRIQPPASTLLGELECHWHDEMELFKVERGRVRVRCGSDYLLAQAGELVFFNSGELHAAQPLGGEEMDYAAVVFSPEILCGDENDIARRKYVAPVVEGKLHLPRLTSASTPEGRQVLELFNRVMDLLFQRPAAYELLVRAGLLELFASLASRGEQSVPPRERAPGEGIKAALEYIQEHYRQRITVDQLAEMSHLSTGHFCRLFKSIPSKRRCSISTGCAFPPPRTCCWKATGRCWTSPLTRALTA